MACLEPSTKSSGSTVSNLRILAGCSDDDRSPAQLEIKRAYTPDAKQTKCDVIDSLLLLIAAVQMNLLPLGKVHQHIV